MSSDRTPPPARSRAGSSRGRDRSFSTEQLLETGRDSALRLAALEQTVGLTLEKVGGLETELAKVAAKLGQLLDAKLLDASKAQTPHLASSRSVSPPRPSAGRASAASALSAWPTPPPPHLGSVDSSAGGSGQGRHEPDGQFPSHEGGREKEKQGSASTISRSTSIVSAASESGREKSPGFSRSGSRFEGGPSLKEGSFKELAEDSKEEPSSKEEPQG